jgi:hypothetical protein
MTQSKGTERQAESVELHEVARVELHDRRTLVLDDLDEALLGEQPQGFSNGPAGQPELGGHRYLLDPLPRAKLPGRDGLAQGVRSSIDAGDRVGRGQHLDNVSDGGLHGRSPLSLWTERRLLTI